MDYLFSLVQSMSATEKRYFTRLSTLQTQNSVNQYAQLFNKLCKLKNYDEAEVKKEFNAAHFAQLKQTLYKKILQALRMFHASAHFENEPNIHLTNSKLLLSKGLVDEARKEFNRAERFAIQADLPFDNAMLFREKNFQNTRTSTAIQIQERLNAHDDFWINHIKQLENELKYERLFLEIEVLNKKFEATRNTFEKRQISDFLQNFLLINDKSAETPYSKILFHFIKGLGYYLSGDYSYSEKYFENCQQLFNENPSFKINKEELYIRTLANLSLIQYFTASPKLENTLFILNKLKSEYPHLEEYKTTLNIVLKLLHFNHSENFVEALLLIEKENQLIKKIELQATREEEIPLETLYLIFQKTFTYLASYQYKKAIDQLKFFLRKFNYSARFEHIVYAKIILFFTETKWREKLPIDSEIKEFQTFLTHNSKVYLFEKQLLKFITNILNSNSDNERKMAVIQLKNDMKNLKTFDLERNIFNHFDFSAWIDSFEEELFFDKTIVVA